MQSFAIFEVLTFFGQSLPADQLLQLRELAPVGARAAGSQARASTPAGDAADVLLHEQAARALGRGRRDSGRRVQRRLGVRA